MLRIATANVNGIRAAQRRGFGTWLESSGCDIVALQEVRCPVAALPSDLLEGWQLHYDEGDRAGRNGTAICSRRAPIAVRSGWGSREFDAQGRYVEADFDLPGGGLTVASLYLPKGAAPLEDPEHYARKMRFLRSFGRFLTQTRRRARAAGREFLIMGDFNIAHENADLKNWRTNRKTAGFLPEEREWFSAQLSPRTLVDVVRRLHPDEPGPYSWWSWRGQAWTTNAGWRIDYHLASPALAACAVSGGTDREPSYDERMSDHSPVVVDYAW